MQRCKVLRLRKGFETNILYQACYSDTMTLNDALGVTKEEVLGGIPYWIFVRRMTVEQLQHFAFDHGIRIPENCPRNRNALAKIIISTYARWEVILESEIVSLDFLRQVFKEKCGPSTVINDVKKHIKQKIKLQEPGQEIIYV